MKLLNELFALLFVAESPKSAEQLAQILQMPVFQVEEAIESLGARLLESSPLQIVKIAGGFQLATQPRYADLIANFVGVQSGKLSKSLLEVLAVVAYKQPVTMAEVEEVRGLDSDYGLRQLIDRRLIKAVGRRKLPGRPIEYGTTQQFLHTFRLNDLSDLPQIELPTFSKAEPSGSKNQPQLPMNPDPEAETETYAPAQAEGETSTEIPAIDSSEPQVSEQSEPEEPVDGTMAPSES